MVDATAFAALVYAAASVVIIGFQVALAAGAPWGEYAMGGRVPGRVPPGLRVAAVVQASLLAFLALVVLDAGGVLDLGWSAALPWLAWVPVVVSAVSLLMNAASRSQKERRTWVPVALVLLVSSLLVALSGG